LVSLEKAV
jgi:hypothetical protein